MTYLDIYLCSSLQAVRLLMPKVSETYPRLY